MDLISREAAIKSLCAYHKGKKTIGQCIDDVPTIQAVPIEVLQEIRQEILSHREVCVDGTPVLASKIDIAVEIIDNCIKEYTNEE